MEAQRLDQIVNLVQNNGRLSARELMDAVGASEATLRRDLAKLDRQGRLKRVRGGAESMEQALAIGHPFLDVDRRAQKRRIAQRASLLCADGEAVIIDGGSTTYQMAPFLTGRGLTVFTNSFPMAQQLVQHPDTTLILPAGEVLKEHHMIYDPFGGDYFGHYAWRTLFMGVQGIDGRGATNADTRVIRAEQAMIEQSERVVILADSTKFQQRGDLRLCGFDAIDVIITDDALPDEQREAIRAQGVELIIA